MKLYWGPHTCAIGTHILLEEVGADYAMQQIDVAGGDTGKPAFLAINPKGRVPTLVRDDGSILTEFGAIARWLAWRHPQAALLPTDAESDERATEIMDYAVGTVHGQGFARLFTPAKFEPQDFLHGKAGLGRSNVEHQGREMVEKGFRILNERLAGGPYAAGERFSIADAALFYVERWAPMKDIRLPENVRAHYERMLERPSVRKVRSLWGES